MSDFADLMRAILAQPDDDLVRLVFADLLEETGQAERAEFIRLQIRMSQLAEYAPEYTAMRKRERELIVANGRSWRSDLPHFTGISWGPFVRGFIGGVEAWRWGDFADAAEQLFEIQPIQHLEIRFYLYPMLAEMQFATELSRLTGLDLSLITLQSPDVAALMRSPNLTQLRELNLGRDQLDDVAGIELFGSPVLTNLRRLKVGGNRFTARSLDELRDGQRPHLEWLNLSYNPIGSEGMRTLAEAKNLQQLTTLDLCGCEIHDAGVETLVTAPWLSSLRVLDLTNNRIGLIGGRALLQSEALADIVRLDLRYNRIPTHLRDALIERFGDRIWLGG